jgi:hypothetical protein
MVLTRDEAQEDVNSWGDAELALESEAAEARFPDLEFRVQSTWPLPRTFA